MRLWINGQEQQLAVSELSEIELPLLDVLKQLGYDSEGGNFVVALNQQLLVAQDFALTQVKEDDKIDILGVITGG